MKKLTCCYLISTLILLLFVTACATKPKVQKKRQEEALRNLGESYMVQGNYTAALQEFLKAEQLYPQDPLLQYDLGLVYVAKERFDLAIRQFKKAIEINPGYAAAKNSLAAVYLVEKEWDIAIPILKEVAEDLLDPTPHIPLSNLGWAYYNRKDYGLAEKYYSAALKKEPRYIIALRGLGRTYLATGRPVAAVGVFEKAVQYEPGLAELHFDLARSYALSGNYQKARDAYQKVIEIDPETPLAEKARKGIKKIR